MPVDPGTFPPAGEPEIVVAGRMGDDFILDEEAKAIYLTTHRQNTIDLISMEPGDNSSFTQIVAGDPFDRDLVGPSSGAWSRTPGAAGCVAYFITDGGTARYKTPDNATVRMPPDLINCARGRGRAAP